MEVERVPRLREHGGRHAQKSTNDGLSLLPFRPEEVEPDVALMSRCPLDDAGNGMSQMHDAFLIGNVDPYQAPAKQTLRTFSEACWIGARHAQNMYFLYEQTVACPVTTRRKAEMPTLTLRPRQTKQFLFPGHWASRMVTWCCFCFRKRHALRAAGLKGN